MSLPNGNFEDGIFFTESSINNRLDAKPLGHIKADSLRMNSNLAKLKTKLAHSAKLKKGNAVVNYKYRQKRTLLSGWDDTKWLAEGDVVFIPNLDDLLEESKSSRN